MAVVFHGGAWKQQYRRDLTAPAASDLARRGIAAWNVEYRRVGGDGGWPATFADVTAAIEHVADLDEPLDQRRVAVVGHSAGGHLVLWALGTGPDQPTGPSRIVPHAACVLAPIADLSAAGRDGFGEAASGLLGGGADDVPERWSEADPVRRVGHGVPVLLVHGEDDESVPVAHSRRYVEAATTAGDPVELRLGPGDHMAVIDPAGPTWALAADGLWDLLG